jgi:hypothetical protein
MRSNYKRVSLMTEIRIGLSPEHQDDLTKRGLSDDAMKDAKIFFASAEEVRGIWGFNPHKKNF